MCGQPRRIIKDLDIEQLLKAYLNKLRIQTAIGRDEDAAAIEEDLATILDEIYSLTWLDKPNICLGDYFDEKNIPGLMRVLFDQLLGGWANQRVICVGDYSDKLPPGYQPSSYPLYDLRYKETHSLTDFARVFMESFEPHCPSKAQFFQAEYSRLLEEFFPASEQRVLLNLDSLEYVVSDELLPKDLKECNKDATPGLGDAVMASICWSQDGSTSMRSDCIDIEGDWAGNRFVITSLPLFNKTTGRKGWKDAGKIVYEELNNIWKSEGFPCRSGDDEH